MFVDLSPLIDPAMVMRAITQAVGMEEESGLNLRDQVVQILQGRQILLILDNFERVVDAAPEIAELLARLPGLAVLATSRMPLHLSGEREIIVEPLEVPGSDDVSEPGMAGAFPSVRLFCERATAARPGFQLTRDNVLAVVRICARLDGLPLAIELTAARVKLIPPEMLLSRLQMGLPPLTGGPRVLPRRQQTLRDTIAWSHELLEPANQILLRRLGVFVGGCTIEAAEAVGNLDGRIDVLEGLAALVDMSLLRRVDHGEEPRFQLLETIREFALGQLAASGEEHAARSAHAQWLLDLASDGDVTLAKPEGQLEWMARFDRELVNTRAAIEWFKANDNPQAVLQLLSSSTLYWDLRPFLSEVYSWLTWALDASPTEPSALRIGALNLASFLLPVLGHIPEAEALAAEAIAAAEALGDPFLLGSARFSLAIVQEDAGDIEAAAASHASAIELLDLAGQQIWSAWAKAEYGDKLILLGEVDRGVALLAESRACMERLDYQWTQSLLFGQQGHAARAQGDLPAAIRFFKESLAMSRRHRDRRSELGAMAGLAGVALDCDRHAEAARLLGAVETERAARQTQRIAHLHYDTRVEQALRLAMGDTAFEAECAVGRTLDIGEAIAEAIRQVPE